MRGGAYSAPPDLLAGGEGARCLKLRHFEPLLTPSHYRDLALPRLKNKDFVTGSRYQDQDLQKLASSALETQELGQKITRLLSPHLVRSDEDRQENDTIACARVWCVQ